MDYKGVLMKMRTILDSPIQYHLTLGDDEIHVNDLINRNVSISFQGYLCLGCGKRKKVYRQGYCYDCFFELPGVGEWVIRPELSTAHLDIEDRDLEYEKKVQLRPHIVYLALSSDIKVGVTRKTQVPTRWIDQGANAALTILEAPNRYLAGVAEVALKEFVADKTNWRKMLMNEVSKASLTRKREELANHIPEEAVEYYQYDREILELNYPIIKYPEKIKSLNLTQTPKFEGLLIGIKGQYLIFDNGTVFNIRGNEGSVIRLSKI